MSIWTSYINGFMAFLRLEKSLSENTTKAYIHDIHLLCTFLQSKEVAKSPILVTPEEVKLFIEHIHELGLNAHSQARILSGIKAFYRYLILENCLDVNPIDFIDFPKLGRKLPDTLALEEIEQLLEAIDLSTPHGTRNRAILETLYGCGLRVSELTDLKISHLYTDMGFIKVTGKGNKERIIPIGDTALKFIRIYVNEVRKHQPIQKGQEDFLFLNRRGKSLTRVMIFTLIKDLAIQVGLKKKISPHTFRHSFATHLIENGADLRSVQDMLGHESILTTEIYTHLDREFLRTNVLKYHPRNQ